MAMTIEKINAVPDERAHLLLSEPLFGIEGKYYQVMTEEEVRDQRIANTAGVETTDLLNESGVIFIPIEKIVRLIKEDITFGLANVFDSKLIFECIDRFFRAQANIQAKSLRPIDDVMIEDFDNLTKLANRVLEYVDLADRIDLMNAPKVEKKEYTSIFDYMLSGMEKNNLSIAIPEDEVDDGTYHSPFAKIINSRRNLNRTSRF